MNKARRAKLKEALDILSAFDLGEVEQIVADMQEEEQEGFDNLSEGLQASERGQAMETACAALEEAKDSIAEIQSSLENAIAKIEEACE